ncbi:serine/threonine-protein kinase [Catellatospora tritici]|uniref:serine/threonine-protein kinase n=1 Tax=Catellatospora tritici TaxID=2851566 RepID=UPI001C2DE481|nr:serine/threonine-protein kinase [Catellatospora tritici]MBV1852893.1 serine/threonine-protein kinase [Catellatospora tritici]
MLDPGVTLGGRYELTTRIARGGMGEVWSADDTVLGRRVAVKVLLPNLAADPGFSARFRAEARAMAALSHPGIVEIYDYGQTDGIAYLVMQFVEGDSLSSLVRQDGPLEPGRAMRLIGQAARAIHAAHSQGIVHRDVKPANLLLRADGRVALTDFGIARIVAGDRLTATGEIQGTASYLAPEQVTGDDIGPATDVYALGVVAYELLTGRRPFTGDTPLSVALQHVHEPPPPLPPDLPEPARTLVERSLAKEPTDRWPTAAAFAEAAEAAATAAATPRAAAATPRAAAATPRAAAASSRRRRNMLAGAGAIAVLAVAAATVLILSSGNGADPAQGQAPGASASAAATGAASTALAQATASWRGPARRTPSATPSRKAPAPGNPTGTSPSAPSPSPNSTARTVPGMYSWTESEVRSELTRLGLDPRITYEMTLDQCYAIRQSPAGGTVVRVGDPVDVVVAKALGTCKQA